MAQRPRSGGIVRLYRIDARGVWAPRPCAVAHNEWMVTWGYIACKCLGQRDAGYGLGALYIEYANVASPTDAVTIPSFTTADDRTYYDDLAGTPDRDYLRVALRTTPAIDAAPGFESVFAPGQGNRLTIFAQSSGAVGVGGKAFSSAANSKVCGVALVAVPAFGDRTRDVLFARSYYDVADQQVKAPSGQFGVEYPLTFG